MIDQLRIGDKYSYDDFEASVKERQINAPKKKSIKATVPFSNVTYDFSAINGEVYWEERTLEYVFEITATTPEILEEKKMDFVAWVMNVMSEDIYDPFITDFHFVGTFDSIDFDDSEIEKSTITVVFTAYPYMLSNTKKVSSATISTSETTLTVLNESNHRVTPTITSSVAFSLTIGDTTYTSAAGTITNESIKLASGSNSLKVKSTSGSGTFKVEFYEEVF